MPKLFLTEEKIGQFLKLASGSCRDYCLFQLALNTGFRVSDLARIQVSDVVDSDGSPVRCIKIKMKKTGQYIERSLRDDCRSSISAYLKVRDEEGDFLFCSESGRSSHGVQPLDTASIYRIYRKYLEIMFPKSMLRGNGCHVTRRSIAKIISQKTGRIEPASQFLGHRNVASTASYLDWGDFSQQANDVVLGIKM